jgi:hypothetical protein
MGWSKPIPLGYGWGEQPAGGAGELTGADGIAKLRVGGIGAMVALHPDYYTDGKRWEDMMGLMPNPVLALNRPDITVTLLKKMHPVPMYVRRLEYREIPELRRTIGFDLQLADWVAPFGNGKISDFLMYCERDVRTNDDYTAMLRLTFSNQYDGIQQIDAPFRKQTRQLRLPREAPAEGYQQVIERHWGRGPAAEKLASKYRTNEDANYMFRVRSATDASGSMQSALYGKIHGDLEFSPSTSQDKPAIRFFYYLNPDGTRSLEWNGQNLFGELPRDERFTPEP